MKNSQKGFVVPLIIAIIVLLVISGSVYIYKNKKAEAPAVVNTQTNNSKSTDISSWKTYNVFDFSFKYPDDWYLNYDSGNITIANYKLFSVYNFGTDGPLSPDKMVIQISIDTNLPSENNVESWANRIDLSDKRNILIDGVKAIRGKIVYTGEEESGYYTKGESSGDYVIMIRNGNNGYEIVYSPYNSKFISTFDQVLSTFKFTK